MIVINKEIKCSGKKTLWQDLKRIVGLEWKAKKVVSRIFSVFVSRPRTLCAALKEEDHFLLRNLFVCHNQEPSFMADTTMIMYLYQPLS